MVSDNRTASFGNAHRTEKLIQFVRSVADYKVCYISVTFWVHLTIPRDTL